MKTTFAASVVLWIVSTLGVSAADLAKTYTKAAPLAAVYRWTGFYVGGNLGGGMASSHFDDPCFACSTATPTNGFFTGGAQIGYNYQFGSGLVGVEADVNGNSALKESVINGFGPFAMRLKTNADASGTIRARGGMVLNDTLFYVTGGAAWTEASQTALRFNNQTNTPTFGTLDGITANRSGIVWGGGIGAGVEFALGPNWTVGGEFLHTMYQDRDANIVTATGATVCTNLPAANCVIRNQLSTDVARIRFNYRFADAGWGADLAPTHAVAPIRTNAAPLAAVYNWTGFYVGNAGGGMASPHFDDPCQYCSSATPTSGFFTGGVQIGYNYQFGSGLVGIEADVNANSNFKDSVIGGDLDPAMRVSTQVDVSGTIRARAGLVSGNTLLYVTGGATWADLTQSGVELNNFLGIPTFGSPTGVTANRGGVVWGGVIGAGVEFALGRNWTLGAEYLRAVYEDRDANLVTATGGNFCTPSPAANCVIRNELTTDVARMRLNYKFGYEGVGADLAPSHAMAGTLAVVHGWTGFYVGGNVGGGMASSRFDDPCFYCSSAMPTSGFFTGGAQIGYNYQFGRGLVGVEADVSGNGGFKGIVIGGADAFAMRVKTNADASGTIRARAGLVVNNALAYVTGGAAWAGVDQTGVEFDNRANRPSFGALTGITANRSGVLWGGVIGAGVEFALDRNWTIGGEFLHTRYEDRDTNIVTATGANACTSRPAASCVIRDQLTTDVARLRFNYKFSEGHP
jgi:opacity protein-like surface antigen